MQGPHGCLQCQPRTSPPPQGQHARLSVRAASPLWCPPGNSASLPSALLLPIAPLIRALPPPPLPVSCSPSLPAPSKSQLSPGSRSEHRTDRGTGTGQRADAAGKGGRKAGLPTISSWSLSSGKQKGPQVTRLEMTKRPEGGEAGEKEPSGRGGKIRQLGKAVEGQRRGRGRGLLSAGRGPQSRLEGRRQHRTGTPLQQPT